MAHLDGHGLYGAPFQAQEMPSNFNGRAQQFPAHPGHGRHQTSALAHAQLIQNAPNVTG